MASTLVYIAYPLAVAVVILFGAAACLYYLGWRRKHGAETVDFFLTARNSVSALTIGWSFYAAAMGSWALFGPPVYAITSGILGVIMYAVSSGIPVLLVAFAGDMIRNRVPNIISLGDFTNRRFGRLIQLYVTVLILFNMGVALTAEYTAVGDLFEYVIGSKRWPIVVVIGVVSMIYTAVGGLFISIVTDQWQAIASIVFVSIMLIYVALTFDQPLEKPLPEYVNDIQIGWSNYNGLASIAVMPISLISSTIYSEAMWQRCWASVDSRSLKTGALIGSALVIIVVFLLGFGGILAIWGGIYPVSEDDQGNTILFELLGNTTWITVIVSLLSVTMSESAVDSLQNAIVDSIGGTFITPYMDSEGKIAWLGPVFRYLVPIFNTIPVLWWLRVLVLVLNVIPIIVSLQGYNVLQLFLLANLITTTSTIPLLAGLAEGRLSRRLVTPFSMILGCLTGIASLFWWTSFHVQQEDQTYKEALHAAFLEAYDWPPFMLALGFSIVGMVVGSALEAIFRAIVPGSREYPEFDLRSESKDTRALYGDQFGNALPVNGAGGRNGFPSGKKGGVEVKLSAYPPPTP